MGLEMAGKNVTYINTIGNAFTISVKQGTQGATSRINKEGREVWEISYPKFTGFLTDIKIKENDERKFGKQWMFSFYDDGKNYCLQVPYSGRFSSAFLKMLPNIDVSKKFTLALSKDENDRMVLFVNQDGAAVKHAYTKDNPNGLPQLEKIVVRGEETWDDTKIMEFLENMAMNTVLPKLQKFSDDVSESTTGEVQEKDDHFDDVAAATKEDLEPAKAEDIPF